MSNLLLTLLFVSLCGCLLAGDFDWDNHGGHGKQKTHGRNCQKGMACWKKNHGKSKKFRKEKQYKKKWGFGGVKHEDNHINKKKRFDKEMSKKQRQSKRKNQYYNKNKFINKHGSFKKDLKKHGMKKYKKVDKKRGKKNHKSKTFKHFKFEYTIKRNHSLNQRVKYLGKYSKFGKFSKVCKNFGVVFKHSKCYKKLCDYKKQFSKYKKTYKSLDYEKAKVLYSKFCNCGIVSKKEWIGYEKKCYPAYKLYQDKYNHFLETHTKPTSKKAKECFDDFCACSKGYYGKKWKQYKPQINYGCTGLFENGKCNYVKH